MNNEINRQVSESEASEELRPGALGYKVPSAPSRERLLNHAYARAELPQERDMNFVARIFSGRRWYVQAGLAAVVLCAAALMWMNPLKPSYAQETPGYMLKYDLGQAAVPEPGNDHVDDARLAQIEDALKSWSKDRKAKAEAAKEEYNCKISIAVNNDNGALTVMVGMAGASQGQLDELKQVLSAVPGLPEPQTVDATWFSDGPLKMGGEGGLSLNIDGHLFTFGEGFTEQEVADTVNKWLAENKPGTKAKVVVSKEGSDPEHQRVRIEVRVEGGDDCPNADQAPAPEAK